MTDETLVNDRDPLPKIIRNPRVFSNNLLGFEHLGHGIARPVGGSRLGPE